MDHWALQCAIELIFSEVHYLVRTVADAVASVCVTLLAISLNDRSTHSDVPLQCMSEECCIV